MPLVPSTLILLWLIGLFSLGLLGGGVWLVWEWYDNWSLGLPANPRFLAAGLGLLAFALLGRPLLTALLGRAPRTGEAEPRAVTGGTVHRIAGPGGTTLHAESHGRPGAPVLLLTHGWGLSSDEWFYACQQFADRYHLLLWDLPGLGRSQEPRDHNYDLPWLAGDLKAVLSLAGTQPVILCGHSIGGMITLTFCRQFPELISQQVAGLVLTSTTPTNPVNTAWGAPFIRALQRPLLRPLCYVTVALSPLVRVMNGLSYLNGTAHLANHFTQFGGQETRGQLEFITRLTAQANPAVVARGMLAMLRYDATDVLPTIAVPTLVVAASDDKATLPEASCFMTREVPGAEEVMLSPAGHLGLLEQHRDWGQAVADFAERCLDSRRSGLTRKTQT